MLYLSQQVCRGCGLKLTEFEINEKDSHCMDCYNENNKATKPTYEQESLTAVFDKRKKTRKYAWYYHNLAK